MQQAISLPHILPRRRKVELEQATTAEKFKDKLEKLGHEIKIRRLTSGLHGPGDHAVWFGRRRRRRCEGIAMGE